MINTAGVMFQRTDDMKMRSGLNKSPVKKSLQEEAVNKYVLIFKRYWGEESLSEHT